MHTTELWPHFYNPITGESFSAASFGENLSASGSSTNAFQYTGQLGDQQAGLYYLRARYYQPEAGRFITRDPFSGYPNKPQTLNAYAYVLNNPILRADLSGLDPEDGDEDSAALFLLGLSDQYLSDITLGAYQGHTARYAESRAYQAGRLLGRQLSNLSASFQTLQGEGMNNLGDYWSCPVLPLVPGTGIARPGFVLVGGRLVSLAGAGLVAYGGAIAAYNALNPIAFKKGGSGGGNPAQYKKLTKYEEDKLEKVGGAEGIKKGLVKEPVARYDLYKDTRGNIFIMGKGGKGEPIATDYNINDF